MQQRQIVDWRAAVWASLAAAIVFLLSQMAVMQVLLGSPWIVVRYIAALALGTDVLPPPASFDAATLATCVALHLPLSFAFGLLIAFVIHRGGFITGVIGGALLGLCLYFIVFHFLTLFVPWMNALRSTWMAGAHALFGAVAGGVYEWLEVERFETVQGA